MSDVEAYLAGLPEDRRAALARVREVVNANLPAGYEECLQYGMVSWVVPKTTLPETYNGQPLALACLGSQKNYMVLHLVSVYGDTKLRTWFEGAYKQTGKKLDMGKACVRFGTLDALPLDVIGQAIAKVPVESYVAAYHASRASTAEGRKAAAKKSARPAQKLAAKKSATKAAAKKSATKSAARKPAAKKRSPRKRR